MKTRIEEAASKYVEEWHIDMGWVPTERSCMPSVASFIAGAEFMQGEVKKLESWVKHHQECIELSRAREHALEEKLKVVVEALENTVWNFDNDFGRCGSSFCSEALKKVREV